MAKKSVVPTGGWENYVSVLATVLETKYSKRNEQIDDIREHRKMERAVKIPEIYKKTATEHRGPYIWRFLNRASALLGSMLPIARILPLKVSPDDQENSSLREKFFNEGVYPLMVEGDNIFHKFVDSVVADGVGVLKCLLLEDRWAVDRMKDEEDEEYNERVKTVHRSDFPIAWKALDTKAFYPVYDDFGLAEVVEPYERDALTIARKFNLSAVDMGVPGPEYPHTVRFVEYWNRTHAIYTVAGKIVKKFTHTYGRPPYFEARCNVEKTSMAYPLVNLQEIMNSFITIMTNYAYISAYPIPTLEPISEESMIQEEQKKLKVELVQGQVYVPPDGYKLSFLTPPSIGGEFHQVMQITKEIMDEVSLAPILYGISPGHDTSGVAANSMIAIAKAVLDPACKSIAQAFNEMAAFIQERIDQDLEEVVPVWVEEKDEEGKKKGDWLELGPKDINGYYKVKHDLSPVLAAERHMRAIWLADMQARGLVSKRYAREEGIGLSAPEVMADDIWLEQIQDQTWFMEPLIQQFMAEHGLVPQTPPGVGTPGAASLGPGGPGQSVVPGVQQGYLPGSEHGGMPER